MTIMAKKIEIWDVDSLIPYDKNPVVHPPEQIDDLISLFKNVGFLVPILVDTDSGIIAGHGRLMAAKKMGLKTVPVIVCDHMDAGQKRAFALADNKVSKKSYWDENLLKVNISELRALTADLPSYGFSELELEEILGTEVIIGNAEKPNNDGENKNGSDEKPKPSEAKTEKKDKPEPKKEKMAHCPRCDLDFPCPK